MLSSKLVSWQLFLVLLVWTCAVLVKPWAADGSLFASKPLSSIEAARAYGSFFGASPPSIYSPPPDIEGKHIESTQRDSQADTNRKASGSPAALLPSISQTHTTLLQNAPTILKSPRNILDRLTSRRRIQHDTRPTRDVAPSHISSQNPPIANQHRQQIQGQDESASSHFELDLDISVSESSQKDQLSTDNDACAETSVSAIISRSGPSDANTTTDASPRRFQNPLSMYDLSSGRSKAQGSCLGLVVGMIVAIVWL